MPNNKHKAYISAPTSLLDLDRNSLDRIVSSLNKIGYDITWKWFESDDLTNKEIYDKSLESIFASEVIIAEITYPSTGVGQQISLASSKGIPVLCLINNHPSKKVKPSSFALGSDNQLVRIANYDLDNIQSVLEFELQQIHLHRFEKFNFISTVAINRKLEEVANKEKLSKSQLLRKIISEWMEKYSKQ